MRSSLLRRLLVPTLATRLHASAVMTATVDPRSICDRYTDDIYEKMKNDNERTAAYEAAITKAAPGRVCLDVGTGALALLALVAARAGAKHVYAVEANMEAAQAARAAVAEAGMAERVTILDGYSTDVTLPEPVDLLMHEIFGEIAGAEGVVAAIADATKRHMRPSALAIDGASPSTAASATLSVPGRARSLVAPAEFPTREYFSSLPFPMIAAPGATALKLPNLPRDLLLAPAATFEELDFTALAPAVAHDHTLAFVAARDGALRGLLVHIELEMLPQLREHAAGGGGKDGGSGDDDDISGAADEGASDGGGDGIDVSSARTGSHWPNVFLMLPDPVDIAAGQRVVVDTSARLGSEHPSYSFSVALEGMDGARRELGRLTYPE